MHNFSQSESSAQSTNARSSPPPESWNQVEQPPMKKTLFYDFLPSKAVEDAERAQNIPHRVTWQLIEIRDEHPLPRSESHDCLTLMKVIDEVDVFTETLPVSHHRAFDYMFRHWPMPVVQDILMGGRYHVKIFESTEDSHGSSVGSSNNNANFSLLYDGESLCLSKWCAMDHYFLNLSELFRTGRIGVGDVIYYNWNTQYECFDLKVVHRET